MNDLILAFTHANNSKPIYVARPLIFSVYYSEANKATHIVANGGAIIPVSEPLDKVVEMWNNKLITEGVINE